MNKSHVSIFALFKLTTHQEEVIHVIHYLVPFFLRKDNTGWMNLVKIIRVVDKANIFISNSFKLKH